MNIQDAMQMTKNFEGYSPHLYRCPAGYLTIGYGRNIEKRGISKEEAEFMFQNDYNNAINDLKVLLVKNSINMVNIPQDVFYPTSDLRQWDGPRCVPRATRRIRSWRSFSLSVSICTRLPILGPTTMPISQQCWLQVL